MKISFTSAIASKKLSYKGTGNTYSDHHAPEMLCFPTGEKSGEGSDAAVVTRSSDTVYNDVDLQSSLFMVGGQPTESGDDLGSFIRTVLGQKPTWALWQPEGNYEDDQTEDDLEGDGKTPGKVWRAVLAAVIDPVCNKCAESDHTALNANEKATILGARALCLVCGYGRCVHTVTNASDDSANDELSGRLVSLDTRNLDDDTQNHSQGTTYHASTTSQKIAPQENNNGSQKASNLVNGGNKTLPCSIVVGFGKVVHERLGSNDAGHDALCACCYWRIREGHTGCNLRS